MPSNDSTRVLEGFLAALLEHHGGTTTTSCVDTSGTMMDHPTTISGGRPMMKVNLIMDNCAIHQTKHSAVRKTFSGCNLRTTSFERPTFVLKEERLLPPPPPRRYLSCQSGEKRDTSPMMPRSDKHKIRSRIEEQEDSIEIPKQSLHQSWTTRRLASCSTMITPRSTSCASSEEASAVLAAADHGNSRWWSSCPMTRNATSQRPLSVELGVHKKFPSPPHPAKRQVSIENEEEENRGVQQELATTNPSSARQVVVIKDQAEDEESIMMQQQHAPNSSLSNKDCNNVMALVDQALHAMANSFPDAVPRDRKTPYHVMPCHHRSHSLAAPPGTRSGTKA